ncbi:mitochondrial inner membrane protease subunit 2 [Blumeria hordei DH14]|uniref:Mitochondrial inner membrane protease subunit 2 n=1 Tax=Blumeria graminis f. sp. hordei (strain DH14) TaxID=546991 RepID=N1JDE6_BLUG1|nr:mitochondrial inner membrane protease subunit 2 [Blumeria hordei DH14]
MAHRRLFSRLAYLAKATHLIRDFAYWPFIAISWLPAMILFKSHIGEITPISGESMYPSFNVNFNENLKKDVVWTKKWKPTVELKRGMVVSIRNPYNPEVLQIKRVIAIEGDTVSTRSPCPVPTVQVPQNHVWVEGDNADASKTLDSNTYGAIPVNLVQGQITHVLLPFRRSGPVRWWEYKNSCRVSEGNGESAPGWFESV